jgi:hypothetical protein
MLPSSPALPLPYAARPVRRLRYALPGPLYVETLDRDAGFHYHSK